MKVHKLVQGSPQWLAHRATGYNGTPFFNASDAPAMMGCSPYKTRSQLLHEMHTGMVPEVDAATQRRFDDGHRFEALARPFAEAFIGQDLYPQVGSEGRLSASFDGLTMDDAIAWEHKSLNAQLAAVMEPGCTGAELPLMYQIQMEQQLMVPVAEKCLFTASRWNDDNELEAMYHCWYAPNLELRKAIMQGWAQFAIDLETYVPEVIEAAPVGRTPETLPALHIEVTGMVTASNLAQYKEHALSVFASVNRDLKTDQDFADAKKAIKWAGDIETRLQAAKQHALSQTESIDVLFKTIDDITEEARRVRLELQNLAKTRDTSLRAEIVADGRNALADHITACNQRIGRPLMPAIPADFATAIKGMSKFENMRAAVSTELARAKISANEWADKIILNLKAIHEQDQFAFLFADAAVLALKDPEFVAMAIKNRVADHQAAEAARVEAERARIAEEERVKAEAAAKARADAEIAAATAAAQAEAAAKVKADAEIAAQLEAGRQAAAAIESAKVCEIVQVEVFGKVEPETTMTPMEELRAAQASPEGAELSPAAQAINEAEGAIRFAKAHTPPTLKLGVICTRLGFQVTADFLRSLGFEPAGRERAAVLFHETDFPRICSALIQHVQRVRNGVTA